MKFGQSIEDRKRYIFLENSNKRCGRENSSRPLNFYGSKLLQRNKKHFFIIFKGDAEAKNCL